MFCAVCNLATSLFSCARMQLYYATWRSNLFAIYSLRVRSTYSINTCFVSSLLNLFVSRQTHRYIIILGQHHRFPGYFCGLHAKDFIASFVQYHFTIVVPPTSSPRFHSSSFRYTPRASPPSSQFRNQFADIHSHFAPTT